MSKKEKSKSWFAKQLKKLRAQLDEIEQVEKEEKVTSVPLADTVGTERYPDVHVELTGDTVDKVVQKDSQVIFHCKNSVTLVISLLENNILRFRYSPNGKFANDFSYAIDPQFQPQETPYIFEIKKSKYLIQTKKIICEVAKDDLKVTLKDLKGNIINEDHQGFYHRSTILEGITQVSISKKSPKKECYFGLGDKSCALNLRGKKLQNWCTDAFGYSKDTDPLYRSIPFYFGLHNGIGYGLFFDNTFRSHFNFDSEGKGEVTFAADGGEMNYYFIYGPELLQVAEKYTQLTGLPELPPIWTLGFHQCRWSYYPERRVHEVAQEFRDRKIPCDAIYLDIDYMDGYRCFTWNKDYFPNPKKMIAALEKKGFQTVVMIDPGIREDDDYFVYKQGVENDYFCKRTDGTLMLGPVWPPNCGFPDFTKPAVRDWWGDLYEELYNQQGVSGFWNDMNEPAVFKVHRCTFPDEVMHHYEGQPTNHAKAHNIYGLQMSRATTTGLKKLNPSKRPFLVTRATYSGGQRFAAVWTGDNIASWEHLQLGNRQCQRLSASGFSFVGTDIGGFFQYPDGELMVRWLQLGIFHPFYRVHSMGNNDDGSAEVDAEKVKARDMVDRLDQEPWAFGEAYTPAAKAAVELRYQLLPYIYTTFWQYVQKGTPMIRSLAFYDQQDPNTLDKEIEFLFGDHLLVVPVIKPKLKKVKLYLPKGIWYDYWSGEQFKGGQTIKYKVNLHKFPLFVQAGAVIPHYPVMQHTKEKPVEVLKLKVAWGNNTSQIYEDNGEGYDYLNNDFALTTFKNKVSKNKLVIARKQTGNYSLTYPIIELEILGAPATINQCIIDGEAVPFEEKNNVILMQAPSNFKELTIS